MRLFALVAMPLFLSGCWMGHSFYSLSEAEQVIEPGKYQIHAEHSRVGDADDNHTPEDFYGATDVTISYAPDGRTIVEDRRDHDRQLATIVEFDKEHGTYIAQMGMGEKFGKYGEHYGNALFALIRITPRGYDLAIPICNDYKRISSRPRIYAKSPLLGSPVCVFDTRADLEAEMAKYAEDPIRWTSYWRKTKQ